MAPPTCTEEAAMLTLLPLSDWEIIFELNENKKFVSICKFSEEITYSKEWFISAIYPFDLPLEACTVL